MSSGTTQLKWIDFKAMVTARSLALQSRQVKQVYQLVALDGAFRTECVIRIEDPPSPEQIDFETNFKDTANKKVDTPKTTSPFAAKTLADGKKLYTRVHGVTAILTGGTQNIDFVIPYNNCKLTGVEVTNGVAGDRVNLKVLDTPTGTISGVPNYPLNQFGYSVNIAPNYYERLSPYDADLIKDLKVRIEYTSADAGSRTVGINLIIHEVKD